MLLLTLNTLTVIAGMTNTLLSRCTSANLGNNGIGTEGTAALSGALRQQSALRHLNLEINSLGDAGAEQLANWLASEAPPCKMRANKLSSLSEPLSLSLSLSLPMELLVSILLFCKHSPLSHAAVLCSRSCTCLPLPCMPDAHQHCGSRLTAAVRTFKDSMRGGQRFCFEQAPSGSLTACWRTRHSSCHTALEETTMPEATQHHTCSI